MNACRLQGLDVLKSAAWRLSVFALCSYGPVPMGRSGTVHVWQDSPSDGPGTAWVNAYHTVQGGIDAAVAGDVVVVTNETHVLSATVNIDKAVTLRGVENATVDGNGAVRCIALNHADAVVEGLTIQNGYTTSTGGGVNVGVAGGAILDCIVANCRAEYGGGVMFAAQGGLMDRCVVVSNRADVSSQQQGGGVYLRTGVTVRNCLVAFNQARIGGGGAQLPGRDCAGLHDRGQHRDSAGGRCPDLSRRKLFQLHRLFQFGVGGAQYLQPLRFHLLAWLRHPRSRRDGQHHGRSRLHGPIRR